MPRQSRAEQRLELEFTQRMDLIRQVLDGADNVKGQMSKGMLASLCAEWLVTFEATTRPQARAVLIESMDGLVKEIVIRDCDA